MKAAGGMKTQEQARKEVFKKARAEKDRAIQKLQELSPELCGGWDKLSVKEQNEKSRDLLKRLNIAIEKRKLERESKLMKIKRKRKNMVPGPPQQQKLTRR